MRDTTFHSAAERIAFSEAVDFIEQGRVQLVAPHFARGSPTAEQEQSLPCHGYVDFRRVQMGKYFIGWLLGIPAIVLVILYLFFH